MVAAAATCLLCGGVVFLRGVWTGTGVNVLEKSDLGQWSRGEVSAGGPVTRRSGRGKPQYPSESIACIKESGVVCSPYRLCADDCVSVSLPGLAL
ncbi:hypothetical protein DPX16_16190 [Anabarilius grahami]|uniref:Secreted protein n=1 Tax=Anabarilius grahami TaxID=495550 RepID=A0A3N0XG28_ANAGA|nr:hypothetical protein DPX16_16190 [Anabarilius grahami]